MTTLTSLEVESYFGRVYAALADLPDDVREELLEELPDHLAEVAAEEDGGLIDRLGAPEAYAAELRAAAGFEPVPVADTDENLLADWGRRTAVVLRRIDERGGRWTGYPRLTDLVQALRPGWWVLRGWLVAQLLSGTHDRASWHGFLPPVGDSRVLGLVLLLAAVVVSVWLGQRSTAWSRWPRRILAAASIVLAIWGADLLVRSVGGTEYVYSSYDSNPQPDIQDLYVYDQNGNPVPNARLYDQNGNPIQLGSGYCPDGTVGPYVNAEQNSQQAWTYPVCPSASGPFQAGPGAVTGLPSPSASDSGKPTPAPSAQAPAPGTATAKPKPTPTR